MERDHRGGDSENRETMRNKCSELNWRKPNENADRKDTQQRNGRFPRGVGGVDGKILRTSKKL